MTHWPQEIIFVAIIYHAYHMPSCTNNHLPHVSPWFQESWQVIPVGWGAAICARPRWYCALLLLRQAETQVRFLASRNVGKSYESHVKHRFSWWVFPMKIHRWLIYVNFPLNHFYWIKQWDVQQYRSEKYNKCKSNKRTSQNCFVAKET